MILGTPGSGKSFAAKREMVNVLLSDPESEVIIIKMQIVGEQIKLARLRRNLSVAQIAERATCSPLTVSRIEKGSPTVSIGIYLRVLYALQLKDNIHSLSPLWLHLQMPPNNEDTTATSSLSHRNRWLRGQDRRDGAGGMGAGWGWRAQEPHA